MRQLTFPATRETPAEYAEPLASTLNCVEQIIEDRAYDELRGNHETFSDWACNYFETSELARFVSLWFSARGSIRNADNDRAQGFLYELAEKLERDYKDWRIEIAQQGTEYDDLVDSIEGEPDPCSSDEGC